ncbi:MAG TPA: hypothetical protein PK908_06810, partial [Bacteroidales bacterium]|nr:hypothetical protein [Bacteroidales bacterium]
EKETYFFSTAFYTFHSYLYHYSGQYNVGEDANSGSVLRYGAQLSYPFVVLRYDQTDLMLPKQI